MSDPAFTLDPSQAAAVELVLTATIGIVTGGPGTGKTTTLRSALDAIEETWERPACGICKGSGRRSTGDTRCHACRGKGTDPDAVPFLLASPTGKAAKRLSEATGRPACTVHRLLEYGPPPGMTGPLGFRRHALNPLEAPLVVIDEASMLDVELADALLAAIVPGQTRLILVGDADQLPSVGAGAVFRDLIQSGEVPVARLTTLHRAAAESWVCSQAPKVLAGEVPELAERDDFLMHEEADREQAVQAAVSWRVKSAHLHPIVLVPQNVGPAGADRLNLLIQAQINPPVGVHGVNLWPIGGEANAGEGDRIIQIRNDYDRGVFNGEIGTIKDVNRARMLVDFDGRILSYDRNAAKRSLRLAYALTIHKSQGSEWPWVVVLCHSTHTRMLSRQLLYTAITRAKKGVVLVGDIKGLKAALKNERDAQRNTMLAERVRGEVHA